MERAISEMEKIRRAEEIYSKRKNGEYTYSLADENKVKIKSIYKILFQLLFLFNIAVIIVAIQNKNYIFTKDFLNEASKYNIDIKTKIKEVFNYIDGNEEVLIENEVENIQIVDNIVENTIGKVIDNENSDNINMESKEIDNSENKNIKNEEVISLSQMDIDVNKIKEKYSLILPVTGTKTSSYGVRESNEIVTKYHTGVDIANSKGTIIKSAITGKVIQVSEQGDYGKHIKISIDNLVTLYAHCDKIYVKEGDSVVQGQDIAEMGSTGNSTGNHLHFEIRFENRYVDPEKLLNI